MLIKKSLHLLSRTIALITKVTYLVLIIHTPLELSAKEKDLKQEGYYFTGLPLLAYSTDDGIRYGARVYFYDNGRSNEEVFFTSPYKMRLYTQVTKSTKGLLESKINLDAPNVAQSPVRIKSSIKYEHLLNARYYGIGAGEEKLTDSAGTTYSTYSDYEKYFLKSDNYSNYKYNSYGSTKVGGDIHLIIETQTPVKILTGWRIEHADIKTWDGRNFSIDDNKYTAAETLLSRDQPTGFNGGLISSFISGIAFDTRDYEPDPGSGILLDTTIEYANHITGSEHNFIRHTSGMHIYYSLPYSMTLALRLGYTSSYGNAPFYEKDTFLFFFDPKSGLGGDETIRGYRGNRFVADTMTLANIELRVKIGQISILNQKFIFKGVFFADAGNVFNEPHDPLLSPDPGNYKYSLGTGCVVSWNKATIIHAYAGKSREDIGISINFGHAF